MKKLNCRSSFRLFPFLFVVFLTPLPDCIGISFLNSLSAQGYGTAVGVRILDGLGLTLQQQVATHTTVEAILQKDSKSSNATLSVLGEQHKNLLSRGFNLYIGGGFYKTWIPKDDNLIVQPKDPWGLSGVGGLEITLGKINISADIKPNIRLGGDKDGSAFLHTGVSVRYVFAGRYFKDDGWKFWKKWQKK